MQRKTMQRKKGGCGGLRGRGRTKVFGVFVEVEAVEKTFLALGFS